MFADAGCHSVNYDAGGRYWAVIRAEPGMTGCYDGPADRLIDLVKDILAGKEVKVPTKEPAAKEDRDKRNQEVNDVLTGNRAWKK